MRITPLVFFASLISLSPLHNKEKNSFEDLKALVKGNNQITKMRFGLFTPMKRSLLRL